MYVRVAALTTICLIACGREDTPAPPPDHVTVTEPGSDPRAPIRYALRAGTTSKLDIEVDLDLDVPGTELGGKLPTVVMRTELAVESVDDGGARVRGTVRDVETRGRAGSTSDAELMGRHVALMRGTVMTATLSVDGRVRDVSVVPPARAGASVPPALASQLDTIARAMETIAMPLPRAPVGVGATWIHTRPIEQQGLAMVSTTTVTLRARTASSLEITTEAVLGGADQSLAQGAFSSTPRTCVATDPDA